MLDLKFIRDNFDLVKQNIINKNEKANIDNLLELDERRRQIIQESQELKQKKNSVSKKIAELKRNKQNADEIIIDMKTVSDKIKSLDDELNKIELDIKNILLFIPNMLNEQVPIGKTEEENKQIRTWGEIKNKKLEKDHIQIAKDLGIIDFERASKISGSGFVIYVGKGAKLERALINFMLDFHTENNGYKEILTPFIVNRNSMIGTGQIPKLEDDMYKVEKDDFYLIPTAEVPITNYSAGEMLKSSDFPRKFCGYSPCFRREAGSYGKDTKGLLRVHQFNKVELVKIVNPEDSYKELESMLEDVGKVLQALELPYRIILLCSGDTSFASAMTYDFEVWAPFEKKWLEVSSCSNFESFQARRANIRFKPTADSKPMFAHTLNGSGLATPRIMASILENYIEEDGSLTIPKALVKYCGFDKIEKV